MRHPHICVLLFLLLTSIGGLYVAEASPKPNIIIIFADDMGYGDCSVNNIKCIRIDDWKLVDNAKGKGKKAAAQSRYELYNLANDPSEEKDISNKNPEMKLQLTRQFEEYIANRRLKDGAQ